MINPKIFYSTFLVNYFDFKTTYLKSALNHYKEFHLEKIILQYSEKDFLLTIKSDVRQTLFQAIETVFEILFALVPDKDGYTADTEILRTLSKGEFHYKEINKIAEDKATLDFLDKEVQLTDGNKVSVGQYIFYFGLHLLDDIKAKISESLEAIRNGLYVLAIEFSDRDEYNCYKHGMRIIPALTFFKLMRADNNNQIVNWDLSNSMTYYKEDAKENKMEFVTKVFDTERDLNLLRLCSDLLWNVIKIRDVAFNKLPKSSSEEFPIEILFFDKDLVSVANKGNIPLQNLRFSTTINNIKKN
jgi:hypothetical protein